MSYAKKVFSEALEVMRAPALDAHERERAAAVARRHLGRAGERRDERALLVEGVEDLLRREQLALVRELAQRLLAPRVAFALGERLERGV